MSSVLAVSAGCVVLNVGVAQWTNSILGTRSHFAGIAAGLVLALESNSLFFGTELRPYAFVILFASIATVCFLRLLSVTSRHEDRRSWTGMIAAILLAILCQPTAIGVLAWLPLVLVIVWMLRAPRQFLTINLSDGFLILSAAAVLFALWRVTLGESWRQRTNWSSFATATRVDQIWEVWDWYWLLVIPLCVLVVAAILGWFGKRTAPMIGQIFMATVSLALIAIVGTSLYWLISFADWVPIWHRRYFIAVLPMFAAVAGGAIAAVEAAVQSWRRIGTVVTACVAIAMVVFVLPYHQGTLARLPAYPVALVIRGEDWRSAVEWVRVRARQNDLVFLDAGLIEATAWLAPTGAGNAQTPRKRSGLLMEKEREYLVFAVNGPYNLGRNVIPARSGATAGLVFNSNQAKRRIYWISRLPPDRINISLPIGSQVVGFGNVSVARQSSRLDVSF